MVLKPGWNEAELPKNSGTSGRRRRVSARVRRQQNKRVLVWWKGKENNGDLMLLLSHLLSLSDAYAGARIELKSIATTNTEASRIESDLQALLPGLNIAVSTEVLLQPQGRTIKETIHTQSADATLVFMGVALPEPGDEKDYADELLELLAGLPTTILVRNAGPFRGQLV